MWVECAKNAADFHPLTLDPNIPEFFVNIPWHYDKPYLFDSIRLPASGYWNICFGVDTNPFLIVLRLTNCLHWIMQLYAHG